MSEPRTANVCAEAKQAGSFGTSDLRCLRLSDVHISELIY